MEFWPIMLIKLSLTKPACGLVGGDVMVILTREDTELVTETNGGGSDRENNRLEPEKYLVRGICLVSVLRTRNFVKSWV